MSGAPQRKPSIKGMSQITSTSQPTTQVTPPTPFTPSEPPVPKSTVPPPTALKQKLRQTPSSSKSSGRSVEDEEELEDEEEQDVEPAVLADAMSKIDTLRQAKTPISTAPTSPALSGQSSPNPLGTLPAIPSDDKIMAAVQAAREGPGPVTGSRTGAAPAMSPGSMPSTTPGGGISVPGTPHFGAQTGMLKTLDESTRVIRQNAKNLNRAPSVSGIGAVVEKPDYSEAKIVVAMVGLPARGKSYLSNKLMRYLRWLEYNVEVFNVGQLRRSKARSDLQAGKAKADHSAKYFNHSDEKANQAREELAEESMESLISWLKKEGNVGIMDATNSTFERREKIRKRIAKEPQLQLLFLESYCDDPAVIAANVALKVQSGDPDYQGMSREEAERDFRRRIDAYERVYQTITEPGISFCRILNVGEQVTMNRIQGYLQSRVAFYLMNLHLKPRSIYLSRHGESIYNVEGKIGGDSDLSARGWEYAKALPDLVKKNIGDHQIEVWTSTLQRTQQTGSFLPFEKKTWKSLDELDAGVCDGMTYEEIEQEYPEDYESRDEDKFNYRYRGGESYRDVVVRLEPVIMELERQNNILVIGHQAILRCIYAYFLALPQEELPYIKIPLHTLIKITPMAYGCHEERYHLPIEAVDTHRAKPSKKKGDGEPAVAEEPIKTSAARDYFGDTSHLGKSALHDAAAEAKKLAETELGVSPTSSGTQEGEPKRDGIDAVKAALQKDMEDDLLTPKAARRDL